MMADKTYRTLVHTDKVVGPDDLWQVAEGDWRDPDIVMPLDGAQVYPTDAESSHSEPDWDKGWELRWGDRDFIEVPPDRPINPNTRLTFKGTGVPPDPIRRAYLEGRVLAGVIVCRDQQKHNV